MTDRETGSREAAPDAVRVETGRVRVNWVDAAGVMTSEHFASAFARALDAWIRDHLGAAESDDGASLRVMKSVYEHRRPLHAGDSFRVDARLLAWEPSRLRVFFQLWREDEIAATCEQLLQYAHGRELAEAMLPPEAQRAAKRLYENQAGLPLPLGAGSSISLP